MTNPNSNQIPIIKIGGNALAEFDDANAFPETIKKIVRNGYKLIISHGGGPQITAALAVNGIESQFIDGLRITSKEAIEIIKNIMCQQIQRDIINQLDKFDIDSVGFCGNEGLFECIPKKSKNGNSLGFVGEIVKVNPDPVLALLHAHEVVVVSALGFDLTGQIFNINADSGAAALASALAGSKLFILSNVDGIYADSSNRNSLLQNVTRQEAEQLLATVSDGMIPKIKAGLKALEAGCESVWVINGNNSDYLLDLIEGKSVIGTEFVQ